MKRYRVFVELHFEKKDDQTTWSATCEQLGKDWRVEGKTQEEVRLRAREALAAVGGLAITDRRLVGGYEEYTIVLPDSVELPPASG